MQMNITGHQVEVTPAIRTYAEEKMARIKKHFDNHLDDLKERIADRIVSA